MQNKIHTKFQDWAVGIYLRPLVVLALVAALFGPASLQARQFNSKSEVVSVEQMVYRFAGYYKRFPVEQCLVRLSQPYYTAGDEVFVYVYVGQQGYIETKKSKVVLAELLDEQNKVLKQLTLKVSNGVATGSFMLPDGLPAQTLQLSLASSRMLSAGKAFFTHVPVYVVDGQQMPTALLGRQATRNVRGTSRLLAFPEGGKLVKDQPANLFVVAAGPNDIPLEAKGYVLDNAGDTVTGFTTGADGTAFVTFTALADSYQVVPAPGYVLTSPPTIAVASRGAVVQLKTDNQFATLTVQSTPKPTGTNKKLYLFVHHKGRVVYNQYVDVQKGEGMEARLDLNVLPAGLYQAYLLNGLGEVMSERNFYLNGGTAPTVALTLDQALVQPRDSVQATMVLQAHGIDNQSATYLTRVIDQTVVPEGHALAVSPLWQYVAGKLKLSPALSAQINAGNINRWLTMYVNADFDWTSFAAGSVAVPTDQVGGRLSIKGRAMRQSDNTPLAQARIAFLFMGSGKSLATYTDHAGYFTSTVYDFEGTDSLIYRVFLRGEQLTDAKIEMEEAKRSCNDFVEKEGASVYSYFRAGESNAFASIITKINEFLQSEKHQVS